MTAPLSAADVALLLDLNARQAGCCPSSAAGHVNWSRYAHDVIFAGASGWTDTLRDHSAQTRALLADLLDITRPYAAAPLSARDLVHGDFLPENVLVREGQVAAVIDFAAIGCGMRALDLARVAVWWHDAMADVERQRLHGEIAAITTPAERAICLAYSIIDLVAFMIAHHPETVPTFATHSASLLATLRQH